MCYAVWKQQSGIAMYKLLIFDWDGTLMDSEARIVACLTAAITDLQLEDRNAGQLRNIIGLGLREAITMLYPQITEQQSEDFIARYRYHFITANPTPSELFSGVTPTLQRLANAGYFLAVATGKGRRGLDQVLADTGLDRLFHATRCADETRSKPHPQMLEEIMNELGMFPEESVMVGDTEYDMEMARNARVDAIAVTYGVHEPHRLHRHGPVATIDRIEQLEDFVARPWRTVQR